MHLSALTTLAAASTDSVSVAVPSWVLWGVGTALALTIASLKAIKEKADD